MRYAWIGLATLALATTATAQTTPPGPTPPAALRRALIGSADLGDFATVAEARAAWTARGGGQPARATAGDWEIAFTADGTLYVLGSVGEVDSGEGMRPPQ